MINNNFTKGFEKRAFEKNASIASVATNAFKNVKNKMSAMGNKIKSPFSVQTGFKNHWAEQAAKFPKAKVNNTTANTVANESKKTFGQKFNAWGERTADNIVNTVKKRYNTGKRLAAPVGLGLAGYGAYSLMDKTVGTGSQPQQDW